MTKEKKKCVHINTRGNNDGKQCKRNVCKKSITGNYCTFHLTQENRGKHYVPTQQQEQKEQKEVKHKIVKDKDYGRYIHIETGFIFYSPSLLVVYSKQRGTKLYPLKRSDIEKCKEYGFKYSCKLYKTINKDDD